ncbi:hypothetical protein EDD21DRAFT_348976 [Dissophora ornata]|nr:hypothetical protein EDD21DRAFT_348976 [Dissophora ornata]
MYLKVRFVVSKWGRYRPSIWVGLALSTACALLNEDSLHGKEISLSFIHGFGLGPAIQTNMLDILSAVETKDIAVTTANAALFRTVGSIFGVAIVGTVFSNAIKKNLARLIVLDPDIANVIAGSKLWPRVGGPNLVALHI